MNSDIEDLCEHFGPELEEAVRRLSKADQFFNWWSNIDALAQLRRQGDVSDEQAR